MTAQPTPEFASLFRDFMVERIRDEHACTGRVFAELHDGDWRPDPKSRSARDGSCSAHHLYCGHPRHAGGIRR